MNKVELINYLDEIENIISSLALNIWKNPETSEKEQNSARLCKEILGSSGFKINEIEGMDHAFFAEYGTSGPVIALLGEYDALPGLSQKLKTSFEPVNEDGPGHGCGHNLLGSAAVGAALAIKKYLDESGINGTIRFYGCPEEETLAGKVKMIQKGAFEGCDLALSWHPWSINSPVSESYLANNSIKFRFSGISAHAAQSPESGRSALDAVELMNVGANYLREHIIDKARIHYTITNAGGAPNIIPKDAESWYYVRAPHRVDVREITKRLINVARGAAIMTDTTMEYEVISGCYEMLSNDILFDLTYKNMEEIGVPVYSETEQEFAREIQQTIEPKSLAMEKEKFLSSSKDREMPIHQELLPKEKVNEIFMTGSSDSGDVSWIMPMNLLLTATWPIGTAAHSWQVTAASGSSMGLKGMIYASKVFAGMAYDLFNDLKIIEDAKAEFETKTAKNEYLSPLKS